EAPPLELLRQLREEGVKLGESTFYRLYRRAFSALPASLMVRFEGVAGEFAQFDFGEMDVRLLDGRKRRVHFAAYRLKYSRWIHVAVVRDERIESLVRALRSAFEGGGGGAPPVGCGPAQLVRALLMAFEASGGVPLSVVFDRAKTVVVGTDGERAIWNATLAQVAIDYGFAIELCAARSPEQKGSVENLVGYVKRSFFRARRFADLESDLPRQLKEWLASVNEERPSRATGEIPAVRLRAEQERMKPLAVAPADYGLRFAVHVGPTALVDFQGIRYAMP